jgi:hypothetical protein
MSNLRKIEYTAFPEELNLVKSITLNKDGEYTTYINTGYTGGEDVELQLHPLKQESKGGV